MQVKGFLLKELFHEMQPQEVAKLSKALPRRREGVVKETLF